MITCCTRVPVAVRRLANCVHFTSVFIGWLYDIQLIHREPYGEFGRFESDEPFVGGAFDLPQPAQRHHHDQHNRWQRSSEYRAYVL